MNIKKSLLIVGYSSWCGLGFIRGMNYHVYYHNKYEKKEEYLYLNSVCHGCYGAMIYAHPLFIPIIAFKELYRLEVNVRNLEKEKNTDYYHTVY